MPMKSMQPRKTWPQWRNHKETRIIIKKRNKKKLTLKGTHIANTDFMSTLKSASTSVSLAQHTMDPNISTLLAKNPLHNLRNPNPRQLSPTPRFYQNPGHLQDQSQSPLPHKSNPTLAFSLLEPEVAHDRYLKRKNQGKKSILC